MRQRTISPRFFDDPELVAMDPLARLMFAGLWCAADREGRLRDEPKRLRLAILPGDNVDGDELLTAIAGGDDPKIVRYVADGLGCIAIRSWKKYQPRIHPREAPSVLPPPPDSNLLGVPQQPPRHNQAATVNSGPSVNSSLLGNSATSRSKDLSAQSARTGGNGPMDNEFVELWRQAALAAGHSDYSLYSGMGQIDADTREALAAGETPERICAAVERLGRDGRSRSLAVALRQVVADDPFAEVDRINAGVGTSESTESEQ